MNADPTEKTVRQRKSAKTKASKWISFICLSFSPSSLEGPKWVAATAEEEDSKGSNQPGLKSPRSLLRGKSGNAWQQPLVGKQDEVKWPLLSFSTENSDKRKLTEERI